MKIQPVKGTRDFYPEQMARRNFIIDGWKRASLRNGFSEYDGPIFEYLKMYQQKSGDEIASQLFSFEDRGGRALAIRPEITPTLARMVNQKINSLPRPIKWFSVPRLCRAERPQKGRLREFFQWNVDIIGIEDCLADAEVIFTAVDYLRQVGLGAKDIVVKISNRKLLAAELVAIGIGKEKLNSLYTVLDKRNKVPKDAFEEMIKEVVADDKKRGKVLDLMSVDSMEQLIAIASQDSAVTKALDEIKKLFSYLKLMGIADFCRFDISIIRGLAYYTGVVFEVFDAGSELRAIGGGGRYDNLLADFGGQSITATGFGMGDCVLEILLEEKGLLTKIGSANIDYFVAYTDNALLEKAVEITAALRLAGKSAEFSYKGGGLGKQLKQASALNAGISVILGAEYIERDKLVIKDMTTGQQSETDSASFLKQI